MTSGNKHQIHKLKERITFEPKHLTPIHGPLSNRALVLRCLKTCSDFFC